MIRSNSDKDIYARSRLILSKACGQGCCVVYLSQVQDNDGQP